MGVSSDDFVELLPLKAITGIFRSLGVEDETVSDVYSSLMAVGIYK